MATQVHYHIHWSSRDSWDWLTFDTVQKAEDAAFIMAQPWEKFTIEEADEICPRCTQRRPAGPKPAHTQPPKAWKHGSGR
jgi:hypothetical protein